MNHPVPDELISAYFDGEVTPDERSQVEQLLESSPELRQQLDDTSKLSALLHSFPRKTAPSELATHVQHHVASAMRVPSASPSTSGRSLRREWTAFGVGILATMASLLLFVRLNHPTETVPFRRSEKPLVLAKPAQSVRSNESLAIRVEATPAMPVGRSKSISAPVFDAEQKDRILKDVATLNRLEDQDRSIDTPETKLAENAPELSDANTNSAQAQIRGEFLEQLKTGDVIVYKVADLSNTVVVVDFTVVDIARGANDLKIVLQKRFVEELESQPNPSTFSRDSNKETPRVSQVEKNSKKNVPNTDDLQVFFVRAPGEELAGAIDEFSKNHPDLNWTPRLPIELPQVTSALELEALGDSNKSLPDKYEPDDAEIDSKAVTAEAELAYGALLARNSITASTPQSTPVMPFNRAMPLGEDNVKRDNLAQGMHQSGANSIPSTTNFQKQSNDDESRKRSPARRGYFQVSAQNPTSGPQPGNSAQNNSLQNHSTVPLLANSSQPFLNNGLGGNTLGGGQFRYWNSLASTENRNSRLVKMLIVLKSEQSAVSRTP